MMSGQRALRYYAVITWAICASYVSTFFGTELMPMAVMSSVLLGALLLAISEIRRIPVAVRAGCFMVAILVYNFFMVQKEETVLSLPIMLVLVSTATSTFLNKKLLLTVTALWNVMFLGIIIVFPEWAFKVFVGIEYVYIFTLVESAWIFAYMMIDWSTKQLKYSEEMTEKARAAHRIKGDFLANMSHEIRTPMNAIVGLSELILQTESTSHSSFVEIQQNALHIKSAGVNLINLINDVMEVAKIERGEVEIYEEVYGVRSMVYDVIEAIDMRLQDRPVSFLTDFNAEFAPELVGDEHRIKQILFNLLGNAVKYTEQGHILFRCEVERFKDGAMLSVSVEDSGIGISESDLKNLFIQYRQLNSQANRHSEGTGLGLAITKRLVDAMDGTIQVKSKVGREHGSTFTVRIPQRLPDSQTVVSKSSAAIKRMTVVDTNVLLVDDNQVNLTVMTELFKLYNICPDTALDGEEAMGKVQEKRYDIVFMDHMMPGMDGIETTQAMRKLPGDWYRRMPIVALTANAIAGMKQVFLRSGMDAFLAKPVMLPELEEVLRRFLPEERVVEQEAQEGEAQVAIKIEGVDVKTGILHCGSFLGYLEVLKSFCYNAPRQMEVIGKSLAAGDIQRITVEVHALKSAANGIGAIKLGERALWMERESKARHMEYVEENMERLLSRYEQIVSAIRAALATLEAPTEGSGESIEPEEIMARTNEILEAVGAYDLERVQEVVNQLKAYRLEAAVKDQLEKIEGALLMFSYAGVENEAQALIELVKAK